MTAHIPAESAGVVRCPDGITVAGTHYPYDAHLPELPRPVVDQLVALGAIDLHDEETHGTG